MVLLSRARAVLAQVVQAVVSSAAEHAVKILLPQVRDAFLELRAKRQQAKRKSDILIQHNSLLLTLLSPQTPDLHLDDLLRSPRSSRPRLLPLAPLLRTQSPIQLHVCCCIQGQTTHIMWSALGAGRTPATTSCVTHFDGCSSSLGHSSCGSLPARVSKSMIDRLALGRLTARFLATQQPLDQSLIQIDGNVTTRTTHQIPDRCFSFCLTTSGNASSIIARVRSWWFLDSFTYSCIYTDAHTRSASRFVVG